MKNTIFILLLALANICFMANAQSVDQLLGKSLVIPVATDTTTFNKYDDNGLKTGYWIEELYG